jgi:uncharacterized protein DUF1737
MSMTYRIVTAERPTDLQNQVQTMIDDGFQPIGGVSVAIGVSAGIVGFAYAQAMLKTHA